MWLQHACCREFARAQHGISRLHEMMWQTVKSPGDLSAGCARSHRQARSTYGADAMVVHTTQTSHLHSLQTQLSGMRDTCRTLPAGCAPSRRRTRPLGCGHTPKIQRNAPDHSQKRTDRLQQTANRSFSMQAARHRFAGRAQPAAAGLRAAAGAAAGAASCRLARRGGGALEPWGGRPSQRGLAAAPVGQAAGMSGAFSHLCLKMHSQRFRDEHPSRLQRLQNAFCHLKETQVVG